MKHTKLQELLAETLGVAPDSQEVTDTIEVFAGWFELVLEDIGLEPASIPSLLRWQCVGPKTVDEQGEIPGLDNNCLTLYNFFGSADHQWPLVRHLSGGDASISQSGSCDVNDEATRGVRADPCLKPVIRDPL